MMTQTLIVLAALFAAGIASGAAPAPATAQSASTITGDSAGRQAPVRGDFEVPVDSLVRLLAVKRAVIAMDDQWRAAQLGNDAVVLDSMLADDWTTTDSPAGDISGTRRVETKVHFLADVKSGERSYESIADSDVKVQIYDDAVVLTGRTTSKGYLKDQRISETSMFTRTYAHREGRWQMVAAHSSAVLL